MGKLYAAEAATNVTRRCVQLAGYDGYTREFPFERLMRDAMARSTTYPSSCKKISRKTDAVWESARFY